MSPRSLRPAPVVAIDGPAGAGKSTVSRAVARELGYTLLDTGALYRCVGLEAHRLGVEHDPKRVATLALDLASRHAVRFAGEDDAQRVYLDERDVTGAIRTSVVSTLASQVSAIPEVREALLQIQRDAGSGGRVVVEGRDIGTVVFPDAEAKFFLTASVDERAARRHAELSTKDSAASLSAVRDEVQARDRRDSARPIAPLTRAPDAELVDSTGRGIDEVVAQIVNRVRQIETELERSTDHSGGQPR
jgi:cytidylate kinase